MGNKDSDYSKLGDECNRLNNYLLSITTHYAQLQLRLKQIMLASTDDRENMLKSLESFAFKGCPNSDQFYNKNDEDISQHIVKERLIGQMKTQIYDLEQFVNFLQSSGSLKQNKAINCQCKNPKCGGTFNKKKPGPRKSGGRTAVNSHVCHSKNSGSMFRKAYQLFGIALLSILDVQREKLLTNLLFSNNNQALYDNLFTTCNGKNNDNKNINGNNCITIDGFDGLNIDSEYSKNKNGKTINIINIQQTNYSGLSASQPNGKNSNNIIIKNTKNWDDNFSRRNRHKFAMERKNEIFAHAPYLHWGNVRADFELAIERLANVYHSVLLARKKRQKHIALKQHSLNSFKNRQNLSFNMEDSTNNFHSKKENPLVHHQNNWKSDNFATNADFETKTDIINNKISENHELQYMEDRNKNIFSNQSQNVNNDQKQKEGVTFNSPSDEIQKGSKAHSSTTEYFSSPGTSDAESESLKPIKLQIGPKETEPTFYLDFNRDKGNCEIAACIDKFIQRDVKALQTMAVQKLSDQKRSSIYKMDPSFVSSLKNQNVDQNLKANESLISSSSTEENDDLHKIDTDTNFSASETKENETSDLAILHCVRRDFAPRLLKLLHHGFRFKSVDHSTFNGHRDKYSLGNPTSDTQNKHSLQVKIPSKFSYFIPHMSCFSDGKDESQNTQIRGQEEAKSTHIDDNFLFFDDFECLIETDNVNKTKIKPNAKSCDPNKTLPKKSGAYFAPNRYVVIPDNDDDFHRMLGAKMCLEEKDRVTKTKKLEKHSNKDSKTLPLSISSSSNRVYHFWDAILLYYRIKGGPEFNRQTVKRIIEQDTSVMVAKDRNRNSTLSFAPTKITVKSKMFATIYNIVKTHQSHGITNKNALYKSFVCHALNYKLLVCWLRAILRCRAVVETFYESWSYASITGFQDTLESLDNALKELNFYLDPNFICQ